MSLIALPFPLFVNGTPADGGQVTSDFSVIVNAINGNLDNTNIGAAGIFASQVKADSSVHGTFTSTSTGFTFLAGATSVTPLVVAGVTSQSSDIFQVFVTSGGTKAFWVSSLGAINVGSGNATLFGDIGAARTPTTGQIVCGGTGSQASFDWNITTANVATINKPLNVSGTLVTNGGFISGSAGAITTAISSTAGQLLFGGAGASSTGAGLLFWNAGVYNFYSSGLGGSTANINGATGLYTQTSDRTLKENVVDLSFGLEEVLKLRPVSFDWIASKETGQGFIAQEVQQVVPRAVNVVDSETGILGISDSALTPVLVKAIQQLTAEFRAYVAGHP